MTRGTGDLREHTADLIVGAYFFAMRACEFSWTKAKGRTTTLTLHNVTFRNEEREEISPLDPELEEKSQYVTICFVNQKNGTKMEKRTQGKTGNGRFCPVIAWARVCRRVRRHFPNAPPDKMVCSLRDPSSGQPTQITAEGVSHLLRSTCRIKGSKTRFGFRPEDLGSRSIRSGAAMALFMMDHSTEKIKILGRWASDAFLAYIRPQVLEWTSIMSRDMTKVQNFLDLNYDVETNRATTGGNWGDLGVMPSFTRSQRY